MRTTPAFRTKGLPLLTNQELSLVTSLTQRFQFIRKIGEGGMSNVFLAYDHRNGQQVAVKVLKEHVNLNLEMRHRFSFEAKILANAQHPGIVRLFSHYQEQNHLTYLIMEHLDGTQLHAISAQHNLHSVSQ